MQDFHQEFRQLDYVISTAERILLFAHTRPDADTVGANLAMQEYILGLGKEATIACFDAFPESLSALSKEHFTHPDNVDLGAYDAVIALDSVDRGFHLIRERVSEKTVVVLMDHHPDISVSGDIVMIDPKYSSTCELVYLFLMSVEARLTKKAASALLAGILFDTGNLQHASVSPRVMEITAALMKSGAPLAKVSQLIYAHQDIAALRLWGKALERARLYPENGMLVTAVTQEDLALCHARPEDIYQVASILSTVPDARFALVLSERDDDTVRASLRTMEQHQVDVSAIAHRFGGGGHRLASGFELPGRIRETEYGFAIV